MQVDEILSSPPYADCPILDAPRGKAGNACGGIGTQYRLGNRPKGAARRKDGTDAAGYAHSAGQLGSLPVGDLEDVIMRLVDVIVGSPPYAESNPQQMNPAGIDLEKNYQTYRKHGGGSSFEKFVANRVKHSGDYGASPGQLGALPAGTAPEAGDTMTTVAVDQWQKCYGEQWKGLIVPEAFAHPAKYARGLIRRIYEHLALPPGSVVLDPFGGVALGALDALLSGLTYVGVELEEKFHKLGNDNLDWWRERWGYVPGFGTARLVLGDSRRLREVVGPVLADVCVSSPPYAETLNSRGNGIDVSKIKEPRARSPGSNKRRDESSAGYGTTPGQLGAMPPGEAPQVEAVVSSPPYEGSFGTKAGGGNMSFDEANSHGRVGGPLHPRGYGTTPGQLGAMPAGTPPGTGGVEALVSSPPFENSLNNKPSRQILAGSGGRMGESCKGDAYGESEGQIGNATGSTFWEASAVIVRECHALLKPGGVACWVVKAFVRAGRLVDFPAQWRALCEAAGFRTVHEHHALLVEDLGAEGGLFEPPVRKTKARKSFFRRLAERKGSPAIDHECVICQVKGP